MAAILLQKFSGIPTNSKFIQDELIVNHFYVLKNKRITKENHNYYLSHKIFFQMKIICDDNFSKNFIYDALLTFEEVRQLGYIYRIR